MTITVIGKMTQAFRPGLTNVYRCGVKGERMQSPKWSRIELLVKASSGFFFGMLLLKIGTLTSPFSLFDVLVWNVTVQTGTFISWSIFTTTMYMIHDYLWRRYFNKISG